MPADVEDGFVVVIHTSERFFVALSCAVAAVSASKSGSSFADRACA